MLIKYLKIIPKSKNNGGNIDYLNNKYFNLKQMYYMILKEISH